MIHRKRTLAAFVLAFTATTLLTTPVLATSLDKVMKGQARNLQAEVRGAGGYYGDCIQVNLTNSSGQTQTVEVPLGLLLVPQNRRVQTMVCAGGENLEAPPGLSKHLIKAFCGEKTDGAPGTGDVFSPGGIAPKDLLRIVKELQRQQKFNSSGQHDLWRISNNFNISEGNTGPISEGKQHTALLTSLLLLLSWLIANNLTNLPVDLSGVLSKLPGGVWLTPGDPGTPAEWSREDCKWLQDKYRQRRQDIMRTMNQVQQQKLNLTKRVNQRAENEKTYIDGQKKWTGDKVSGELKDIFIPNPR